MYDIQLSRLVFANAYDSLLQKSTHYDGLVLAYYG